MRGEKKNNKLKCNVCVGLEEKGDQAMLPICEDIVISEANVSYSCDECDQLFKSKGQLTKHRKAEHNVKLRFECKQCGNCYSSDQVYYFKQLRFYFENPFVIFYGFKKWSLTSGNWDTVLFSYGKSCSSLPSVFSSRTSIYKKQSMQKPQNTGL